MPSVAPPFPVAQKPHLDFEIRELYRRVGVIERLLRTSAPSPAPTSATVKITIGKTIYCVRGTVHFDQGWGRYLGLWGAKALYLLKLKPPSLVLSVLAYLSRAFQSNDGEEASFGGFVLADIEPDEILEPGDPEPPVFPRSGRYWGDELDPDATYGNWVSAPIPIEFKVQHPSLDRYWYNIRRYQPRAREGLGRQGIGSLPHLPFTCGWIFSGERAAAETGAQGWPDGMQGAVTVVAVWIDRFEKRVVPGVSLRAKSLFALKPVKVGPR